MAAARASVFAFYAGGRFRKLAQFRLNDGAAREATLLLESFEWRRREFFGAPVLNEPVSQTLTVRNLDLTRVLDRNSRLHCRLTAGYHQVQLQFNGVDLGTVTFAGRDHPVQNFPSIGKCFAKETIHSPGCGRWRIRHQLDRLCTPNLPHKYRADNNASDLAFRAVKEYASTASPTRIFESLT